VDDVPINAGAKKSVANSICERDSAEMVGWETHGQHAHVTAGLNPFAIVLEHSTAWCGAMHSECMTADPAQEFGKDIGGQSLWGCPVFLKFMFGKKGAHRGRGDL
jgi:hypothetical protein